MKVIMLKTIKGKEFSFMKGEKYKALDGDGMGAEDLAGKILVKQPNSPKGKNWWCTFSKSCIGKEIALVGCVMGYKAKNVDTDKALECIEWNRKYQDDQEKLAITATKKHYEGVRKGLDIGEEIFQCRNYEKDEEPIYADGVLDVIYELGKELDIQTQDIRENFSSVDEACAVLAERIKNADSVSN